MEKGYIHISIIKFLIHKLKLLLKGLEYLFRENLVENDPLEIAKFINSTKKLNSDQKEKLFKEK